MTTCAAPRVAVGHTRALAEEAFGTFCERLRPQLERYVRRCFSQLRADAEDLVQDAILRAWRAYGQDATWAQVPERTRTSCLYTILHNAAMDRVRQQQLRTLVRLDIQTPTRVEELLGCASPLGSEPELHALAREECERLLALARGLGGRAGDAETYVRLRLAGYSPGETAHVLGRTRTSAKLLAYRLRLAATAARREEHDE